MRYLFCTILILAVYVDVICQSKTYSVAQLEQYFKIKSQQVEYQGKTYTQVYPALNTKTNDQLAAFMRKKPRRFEYILQNKTQFADYSDYYPDTVQMNKSYAQRLSVNEPFLNYFSKLSSTVVSSEKVKKEVFTKDEMMLVGSRFFLCDRIKPDTTIGGHVCIGLNGIKEANWTKDYTLLAAFCFEAIFDKMFSNNSDDTKYMEQFLKYVNQSTKTHKASFKSNEQLLKTVKAEVFRNMQSDDELRKVLMVYYNQNAKTLPFKID